MRKKDVIEQDAVPRQSDAAAVALQLSHAIQQLVGLSCKDSLQNMPEQIIQMLGQMQQVETKQQQTLFQLESVKQQLDGMVSASKLLENASKTNHLLGKQHYDEHITQPILRSLLPVLDLIEDARKSRENQDEDISRRSKDLFDAVWSQLEQFLANYDLHILRHNTNDRFDPQSMKPVTWTPTEDARLNGHVAKSLQIGFRLGEGRMLRLETVSLFKHQPSQNDTVTLDERVEQ